MSGTENTSDNLIIFPEIYAREKLDALYRAIPLKDTASRMLRRYFGAMANLYGIIPLSKAYEIISAQSPTLVTRDEFLAFAEIARHEDDPFSIMGGDELFVDREHTGAMDRWIIDPFLLHGDDNEPFLRTLVMQEGKPYYVPDKRELLRYETDFYFEQTPQLSAMKAFLASEMELDEDTLEGVVDEMLLNMRYADPDFDVMEMLEVFDVAFISEAEMSQFIRLYQALNNHTRMQSNCGHTPNELAVGSPVIMREPEMNLVPSPSGAARQAAKPAKVGRNEPCPCGSGKKYKHCCGR